MDLLKRSALPALTAILVLGAVPQAGSAAVVSNQLIVGFKPGVSQERQKRIIARANGDRRRRLGGIRGHVIRPRSGGRLGRLRRLLKRYGDVAYVERDVILESFKEPNDPFYPTQYSISTAGSIDTDTNDAWNIKTSCSKVAVLDTGVDTDHPDLKSNLWKNSGEKANNGKDDDKNGYVDDYYGVNVLKGRGSGEDDNGHGTHVAGIIAGRGNNGAGVSGICWSSKVMAIKFMNSRGQGATSDAVEGIEYAIDHGVKIVNASFGSSSESQALKDEIKRAKEKGVLIVAAAGNNGQDIDKKPMYPASFTYGNLLVVAASTSTDGLADFSNYGDKNVDMAAPGDNILSTYPGGGYAVLSGTSMAAPMVAGAAALLRKKDTDASYSKIRKALRDKVDSVSAFKGKMVREGRINPAKALGKIAGDSKSPAEFQTVSPAASFSIGAAQVVTFSWNATSDSSKVIEYEVYVDGASVGKTADPDGTGSGLAATSLSVVVQAGSHSWYAKARDAYQNARKSG